MNYIFLISTIIVSIIAFEKKEIFDKFKFNPYMVYKRKEWGRLFSHGLVHADWGHLIFNMITLYFFGENAEKYFMFYFGQVGTLYFAVMYVTALAISSIPALRKHRNDHYYNAVGASGAVSAVLFSSILFDPHLGIGIMFIPIPIPGYIFGILYLAYSHYMGKRNMDNIGHEAHLVGALYGFILPVVFNPGIMLDFVHKLFN
jgi:membrane associated rhomboid family serine protease